MSDRRTPLYEKHKEAGARFVSFGGWEMPVQYAGIQAEHEAVRTAAGLFDVSHMGEVDIRGDDAVGAFNRLITNDLEAIEDGQALYTVMCRPDGGIVDDLIVYRFGRDRVFVCTNAANRDKDFAWIAEHLEGATATDRGDEFAQIAIQGPRAPAILQRVTRVDLGGVGRFRFVVGDVAGVESIVARTGYTGEDGFELYLPADRAPGVWDALREAGGDALTPAGLGARDTLRLEMKYMLYGNDIDETTTPLEAGLGWVVKLDKADFVGREALARQKQEGVRRRLVGFQMDGRAIARHGYPVVDEGGDAIGHVTSGTRSPTLGVGIGLAYVPVGRHRPGTKIDIQVRQRTEPATIVKTPFVKR